jgi:hypothetical protein
VKGWHVIVCAQLAQGVSPLTTLPALVRQLRRRTDATSLSGGLLFDGERIVLLFEGDADAVHAMLAELEAAPQLAAGIERRFEGPLPEHGLARTRWIAGYAEPEQLDTLLQREDDALARLQAFRRALEASDAI